MGNHASLSLKQVEALAKFLEIKLGDSVDELIEEMGEADAFTLVLLRKRLVGLKDKD